MNKRTLLRKVKEIEGLYDLAGQVNKLTAQVEDVGEIARILQQELNFCLQSLDTDVNSQFWRRTLLRSLFSNVENMLYQMRKLLAAFADVQGISISHAEHLALSEKPVVLTDKGDIDLKDSFHNFQRSTKFTLNIFCKYVGNNATLDYGDNKWQCVCKAYEYRNAIAHPKSLVDFDIDQEKLKVIMAAAHWFNDVVMVKYRDGLTFMGATFMEKVKEIKKTLKKSSN